MAKISNTLSYPNQAPIEGGDYLIGTAANSTPIVKQTKTFTLGDIANFVIDQAFDGCSYRLPIFTGSSAGEESFKLVNSLFYQDVATNTVKDPCEVPGGTVVYLDNGSGIGSLSIAQDLTVGRNTLIYGTTTLESLTNVNGGIYFNSAIYDANGDIGNSEQVLVSDSSGSVTWQNFQGSGLEFQGAWDADLNSPDLFSIPLIPGNTGKYWVVSVAGSTPLSGITDWEPQDWAIISEDDAGNVFWAKIDNSPAITGSGTINTLPLWVGTQILGDSLVTQDADPATNPLVTVNGNIIIGSNQASLTGIESNDNFELFLGESTASQISLNGQNNSLAGGYFLAKWKGDTTSFATSTGRLLIQDMPNGIFNFDARVEREVSNTSGTYAKLFQVTEGYGNHKFSITQDGGDTAQGNRGPSFNLGGTAYANGTNAVSMGASTTAFGNGSLAANFLTLASGGGASAFGLSTEASALASAAFGNKTLASGPYSISSGQDTIASGQSSVAIGEKGDAQGKNSFVQGFGGIADANNAASFGFSGTASAPNSMALGFQSTAGADGSVAAGYQNIISSGADYSFASGKSNSISGVHSAVFGSSNIVAASNSLTFGANNENNGNNSITGGSGNNLYSTAPNSAAFGSENLINAPLSFASGQNNTVNAGADISALFGEGNVATGGERAFATGKGNQVLDKNTFATGVNNEVLAENAFAAGSGNISTAFQSAAFGLSTEARGNNSFTFGENSIASGENSFAGGKLTNASAERAVALGNGTTSSGPNAFSIGNGSSSTAANSASFGQNNAAGGLQSFATGNNNIVSGNNAAAFGQNHDAGGNQSFTAGGNNDTAGTTSIAIGTNSNVTTSGGISVGSDNNVIGGANSIAIGREITLDDSSPTFAFGWKLTDTTSVQGQVVIGQYNESSSAKVVIGAGTGAAGLNAIEAYTSHIALGAYGSGNVTGTPTYFLAVDANGKVVETTGGGGGGGVTNLSIGNSATNTTGVNTGITLNSNTGLITLTPKTFGGSDNVGLVPSSNSASQTTSFLRADGSWAVPSGGSGGVTKIIAGSGVSISPTTGLGDVTINATGGGGGGIGGSGTVNTIAMFTPNGTTVGDSTITLTNAGTAQEAVTSNSKILQVGPTTGTKSYAQINLLTASGDSGIIDSGLGSLVLRTSSSTTSILEMATTGALQAKSYGSGTFTGTAAYALSVDSLGNIIETTAGGGGGGITSIELDSDGDATSGNTITTNGKLTLSFEGDPAEYINGEGNLVAFPTIPVLPANIVESVTTPNAARITIGGTSTNVTVNANVAAVADGAQTLANGDQIYDFVTGQGYTSNTGTVTSVSTTHAGNAFTATVGNNSNINPSIDIDVVGNANQYINGAGDLTTFPTIPSASTFQVVNVSLNATELGQLNTVIPNPIKLVDDIPNTQIIIESVSAFMDVGSTAYDFTNVLEVGVDVNVKQADVTIAKTAGGNQDTLTFLNATTDSYYTNSPTVPSGVITTGGTSVSSGIYLKCSAGTAGFTQGNGVLNLSIVYREIANWN